MGEFFTALLVVVCLVLFINWLMNLDISIARKRYFANGGKEGIENCARHKFGVIEGYICTCCK
jgi:hypothetical protein